MVTGYLALTDADREAMLAGDRRLFDRGALRGHSRAGAPGARAGAARARLRARARARAGRAGRAQRRYRARALLPRGRDLRPLRAGGRRGNRLAAGVPDRVHAVPAGAEPGSTAGHLRVPDRDLRADRDGRLERLGLRRRDGRRRRLLHRRSMRPGAARSSITRGDQSAGPAGREDLCAGVRAGGRRGAAHGRRDRSRALRRRGEGRRRGHLPAAELLRLPRSRRPSSPRAANEAGRAAGRARRPALARRARGARQLRLRDRDRRGPGGRQLRSSYGGPHYGFLAAQRRAHPAHAGPHRRRDERPPRAGAASSSRSRPASSTSGARRRPRTSPPTRRSARWPGSSTSPGSGRRACASLGETCMAPRRATRRRSSAVAGSSGFAVRATFKEFAVRRRARRSEEVVRERAKKLGVHPGYALGRDYPGWTTCCSLP